MKKLAGLGRAPRRRWVLAIATGSVVAIAGVIAFALPAFANHVGNVSGNCNEAIASWVDFPDQNVPVHIVVTVEGVGSKSVDVTVHNGTPPTHVNIADLTAQLNGQEGTVTVRATWNLDGQHHDEGDDFTVTCGNETTSTSAASGSTTIATTSTTAATTTTSVPVTVTTGGGQATTTVVMTSPSTEASSTTTSTIVTSPETAVRSGGTGTGSSSLPFTGGAPLPLVFLGFALILGGAAAIFAPRRRSEL